MRLLSCVLDANVAVKFFLQEPLTTEVTTLFLDYIAHPNHRELPLLTGDQRLINSLAGSPFELASIPDYMTSYHTTD